MLLVAAHRLYVQPHPRRYQPIGGIFGRCLAPQAGGHLLRLVIQPPADCAQGAEGGHGGCVGKSACHREVSEISADERYVQIGAALAPPIGFGKSG